MSDSIYKSDVESKLLALLEQTLIETPFRIIDIDLRVGPSSILRVFIEKKIPDEKTGRKVTIADCVTVSKTLDPVLETDTTIPRNYDLEVSSAGLDRRLRLKSDFEEAVGSEVKLALTEKLNGVAANVRAKLIKLNDAGLVLNYNGSEVPLSLKQIAQATLVWDAKNQKGA